MITGNMRDRPQVTWSSGDSGLFTIMILDEGISFLNGQQYAHWLVTNVPGSGNALEGIFNLYKQNLVSSFFFSLLLQSFDYFLLFVTN